MTDAEIQSEWLDLVDDVENGLIQRPEQQFQKPLEFKSDVSLSPFDASLD